MGKKKKPDEKDKGSLREKDRFTRQIYPSRQWVNYAQEHPPDFSIYLLPVGGDEINAKAQRSVLNLYAAWLAYQNPKIDKKLRKDAKKLIERVFDSTHPLRRGIISRTISLGPSEKPIREGVRDIYKDYQETEGEELGRKERERHFRSTLMDYLEKCEKGGGLFLPGVVLSPGWRNRVVQIRLRDGRGNRHPESFVNDVIDALTGHTSGSRRLAKHRRKNK